MLLAVLYVPVPGHGADLGGRTQLLFWGTPIIYVIETVPESVRELLMMNPLAVIIEQARHAVIDPSAPSAAAAIGGARRLLIPLGIAVALLVAQPRALPAGCGRRWPSGSDRLVERVRPALREPARAPRPRSGRRPPPRSCRCTKSAPRRAEPSRRSAVVEQRHRGGRRSRRSPCRPARSPAPRAAKADTTLGWRTSTTGRPQAIISFGMRE